MQAANTSVQAANTSVQAANTSVQAANTSVQRTRQCSEHVSAGSEHVSAANTSVQRTRQCRQRTRQCSEHVSSGTEHVSAAKITSPGGGGGGGAENRRSSSTTPSLPLSHASARAFQAKRGWGRGHYIAPVSLAAILLGCVCKQLSREGRQFVCNCLSPPTFRHYLLPTPHVPVHILVGVRVLLPYFAVDILSTEQLPPSLAAASMYMTGVLSSMIFGVFLLIN